MRTLLIILFLLVAWDAGWWLMDVTPMGPWQLKAEMTGDEPPLILDVRTPGEYYSFHIPGAVNVPAGKSLAEYAAQSPDPNRPVVVVCMSGHRSPPVARQMQNGGYTNVRNLTWGMAAWKLFGGETESGR